MELYDVLNDPLEMNNLADDPQHSETIAGLRKELERWMESQGDKGIETELAANSHKKATPQKTSPKKSKGSGRKKKKASN